MARILDLGCGVGDSWRKLGRPAEDWQLIGVDIAPDRLQVAQEKYVNRGWRYICAQGERIPLPTSSMDGALCWVALPYMHIPRALAEIHRVLVPGGWFVATLHPPAFTWSELKRASPRPKASLFRSFVILNGLFLHFSGDVLSISGKAESFQTESGMQIALRRAGFTAITFQRINGELLLEARRDGLENASRAGV